MMNTPEHALHILVAGGAGYIGSAVTAVLIEEGCRVTVLDNLSKGHRKAVHPEARFIEGDISDRHCIDDACGDSIDVAMHFAAFIEVGESTQRPSEYYTNNFARSLCFFDNLRELGVKRIVFSSTAAVYGEPEEIPLTESASLHPVSPYGWSKMMIEQALLDYDRAYDVKSASLRYFNAGGAVGSYGEDHHPESHLIPLILDSVINGAPLKVFGTDYETKDGSCIRDYIHVKDIADAHILAARYLCAGGQSDCFNLGTGTGYSVLEVIRAVERVVGAEVAYDIGARRLGDSAQLIASAEKAQRILGWKEQRAGLEEIIESAWNLKRTFPQGYGD